MSREIPDAQLSHSRPSSCSTRETELLNVSAVLVVFLRSLKRLGELDTRIRYQSSRVCGNGKLVRSCFAALVTGKGGCKGLGEKMIRRLSLRSVYNSVVSRCGYKQKVCTICLIELSPSCGPPIRSRSMGCRQRRGRLPTKVLITWF